MVYEDNLIHIYSRYDEEKSRVFFEQWYWMENPGFTVTTEIVADAETFEETAFYYRGEKDGETVSLVRITAEYDVPEPSACRILKGLLESDNPNRRTVSVTFQPGTDEEAVYEASLPVNLRCEVLVSGVDSYVCFADREATRLTDPDFLTDFICCIFPNPDEELLERFNALVQQAE